MNFLKLLFIAMLVSVPAFADFVPGDVGSPASFPNGLSTSAADCTGQSICSDDWTPVAGAGSNVDATGASLSQYFRIGDRVMVFARVTVDVNTASTATAQEFSLPIASDFTAAADAIGDCATVQTGSDVAGKAGFVEADTTNDTWSIRFRNSIATNQSWACTFSYIIK